MKTMISVSEDLSASMNAKSLAMLMKNAMLTTNAQLGMNVLISRVLILRTVPQTSKLEKSRAVSLVKLSGNSPP